MGFQGVVMFIDSFMDDVTYVSDVESLYVQYDLLHTGRGDLVMALRILGLDRCMMTVLDWLAQPHSSIP
jgi:hypothetical protein